MSKAYKHVSSAMSMVQELWRGGALQICHMHAEALKNLLLVDG